MTKQQRLVLIISILASFIGGLDGFIVNVALPAISRDLGGGLGVEQWAVDGYLLTLGSLILIAGSLSDLFGRKKLLMAGLWIFGLSSLLCALAPNGTLLVIGRALQGIGGALMVPSSLALIMSTFSGPAQGKAIGTWTGWSAMSALIGPILGGLIISFTSWRWIFAINVLPIGITLELLRRLEVPERIRNNTKVDTLGAVLCALGLGGPVFALIEQPQHGWSSPLFYLPFVLGLLLLAVFIWYERRNRAPMLPLSLFSTRNFAYGNIATFAIYAGLSVSSFILVIVLQQVGHYSALKAGLASLPVTIIMFFLSGRFGALAGRFGPRLFMTAGPLLAALGFLLLLRTQTDIHYLSDLLPGLLAFGLGLSMTVAPLTSAILGAIPAEHAGVASAVNNAVARVAGLIAIALVGVITGPHLGIDGYHRVLVVVAVLMIVGGAVSAIGIRNPQSPGH
jgi:EmrB/QacA subfamily drug resistance transporter